MGNILLSDEGFGVHFVEYMRQRYLPHPDLKIVDGGTAGMFLSSIIDRFDRLLIVDTVDVKAEPGTIFTYDKDDFFLDRLPQKLSPHQLGLQEVLLLNELQGKCPEDVFLIGIVPQNLDSGTGLSESLLKAIPEVERLVLKKLSQWGIELKLNDAAKAFEPWWQRR